LVGAFAECLFDPCDCGGHAPTPVANEVLRLLAVPVGIERVGKGVMHTFLLRSAADVRSSRAERGRLSGRAIVLVEVGTSLPADRRRPRAQRRSYARISAAGPT